MTIKILSILSLMFIQNFSLSQINSYGIFSNINITNQASPQNEASVMISRANPNRVVAAWRDFRNGSDPPAVLRVGYSYSTDGGLNWAPSQLLDSTLLQNYPRNGDPVVAVDGSGNFYISVIASNFSGNLTTAVYKSTDEGVTFPNAYFVTQSNSEDKEWMTCDMNPSSPYFNNIYISWSRFAADIGIKFSKSTNGGVNWSEAVNVSPVSSGIETAPGICVSRNGQINLCWLGLSGSSSEIRFVRSTDGGINFGTDITVSSGPPLVLTIGNVYTFPAIAVDNSSGPRNGWLYITFADIRNGDYDIFICRSTNSGANWSLPVRVNNDIINNGKLQIWPAIAVNEAGNLVITFIDTRNTPDNSIIECYMARSSDGGSTFTNELISSAQSPTNYPGEPYGTVRFGEYIGVDYIGNRIVPVWTDERAGGYNMEIYTADIHTPVGINTAGNEVWKEFSLYQNYPNPFNPVTRIKYELRNKNNVSLKIYDVKGNLINILVNEIQNSGSYSVVWNAANHPSGVYFCRFEAGEFTSVSRMLLIK